MSSDHAEQEFWEAVVVAEKAVVQRRADFYQKVTGKRELLASALRGGSWERRSALNFMISLYVEVEYLVPELMDLAVSQDWALMARRALAAPNSQAVLDEVGRQLPARLPASDALEIHLLSQLLVDLKTWDLLAVLIRHAVGDDDPEIRDVGSELEAVYGPLLRGR